MIKRTLHFGNPAYLSTKNKQLVINYPNGEPSKTVAIEDVGVIVLEDPQITISNGLLEKLTTNNVAVITCNSQHLPTGLLLPLNGHTEQSERYKNQIECSIPLKKNLWQQTIVAKINNQAALLKPKGLIPKKWIIGLEVLHRAIHKITKPELLHIIGKTFWVLKALIATEMECRPTTC